MRSAPTPRVAGRLALFAAVVVVALTAGRAQAQTVIDPNDSIGPVPNYAGTGLFGLYNLDGGNQDYTGSSNPIASFLTTNVCFPDCLGSAFQDGTGGLAAFTNGNATNITFFDPNGPVPTDWSDSQLNISGYLAITQPGTYSFFLSDDDYVSMSLGGQPFVTLGCCGRGQGPFQASFSQAGLYAIALQFIEVGGQSYLDLTGTDPSGACILGCYSDGQLEPNGLFYSDQQLDSAPAPTPGTGLMSLAVALGAIFAIRLGSRRRGNPAAE
jgi:hypothetical protein